MYSLHIMINLKWYGSVELLRTSFYGPQGHPYNCFPWVQDIYICMDIYIYIYIYICIYNYIYISVGLV